MKNGIPIASFVCSAACFGGAIYRFVSVGVTMMPLMLIGIGSVLLCVGIIAVIKNKERNK